ncbi:AEL313Cp [Eremothecium gossypii ATCC 10895]|uniref:AEL313Cp n=1 Tax=Eremothecium gossypii (strain ATCC 10895 / CBS 109.51 / FGSC 9923 / NRRL Y-1056) TaxID=284811 RepID=Q758R6_EREGS|nr:AEL313Cp [Eremothecium gossypii ATCC 10895]AAS52371.1 AEL313Cp [Eremothecium gossypii ATCC 10895]AEY96668.1 FAEL313Cp [Eremothecium gossypii FDAG1]
MGWFNSSKAAEDQTRAPDKASRQRCWESRDAYFECLDSINVVNALDPTATPQVRRNCGKQEDSFHQNCVTSWIKYFKEKRVSDSKRDAMVAKLEEQGARRIELGYVPPSK